MNDDVCAVCDKQLFQNGKRLTKLCYYIGVGQRKINDNGWYADGTLGGVHICKKCFSEKNKKKMINALFGKIIHSRENLANTGVEVEG